MTCQAKTITTKMLLAKDACSDQVAEFKRRFSGGVTFASEGHAVETCLSVAHVFDWDWAARFLLSPPALAAYEEARATAWAVYEEARATAVAAYEEARATALAAYEEATATALAAYGEATATALAAYWEAKATAWARAFWADGE